MAPLRRYGQLTLAPPHKQPDPLDVKSNEIKQVNYVWTPPLELSPRLSGGFAIPIACIEGFGMRMFRAAYDVKAFRLMASLAGQSIMELDGHLSAEDWRIGGIHRFLYQLQSRLRERISVRRSLTIKDLYVRSQDDAGAHLDILPDDFGALIGGKNRWSPSRLIEEGLNSGKDRGIADPEIRDQISLGIDSEAKLHPIDTSTYSADEIRNLIRIAMFDEGPATFDESLKSRVLERLRDALNKHLDLSTDQFHDWFFEKFDDIVRQISKRNKKGGVISRHEVRQAILDLTFDSWIFMGQAIDTFMRAVAGSIEPPLSTDERSAFDAVYACQPQMGDLPLILFYEHFSIAQPSLLEIIADPNNPQTWGRFHRVLQTYATMIRRRRVADRQKKSSPGNISTYSTQDAVIMGQPSNVTASAEVQEIVQAFLISKEILCDCSSKTEWNVRVSDPRDDGIIPINVQCPQCRRQRELAIDQNELVEFGRALDS